MEVRDGIAPVEAYRADRRCDARRRGTVVRRLVDLDLVAALGLPAQGVLHFDEYAVDSETHVDPGIEGVLGRVRSAQRRGLCDRRQSMEISVDSHADRRRSAAVGELITHRTLDADLWRGALDAGGPGGVVGEIDQQERFWWPVGDAPVTYGDAVKRRQGSDPGRVAYRVRLQGVARHLVGHPRSHPGAGRGEEQLVGARCGRGRPAHARIEDGEAPLGAVERVARRDRDLVERDPPGGSCLHVALHGGAEVVRA